MKTRNSVLHFGFCVAALTALAGCQASGIAVASSNSVLGEKLDSGLGELPHYREWIDPTGRAPMGSVVTADKTSRR